MTSSVLQALRRNWFAGLLGLMVTLGLAGVAVAAVPATYVASAQMVLLPPASHRSTSDPTALNPYLGLSGLQGMADIIARAMTDDRTATELKDSGVTAYAVHYDPLSAGPVLLVQAEEASPGQASSALTVLLGEVQKTTARLQGATDLAPATYVTAELIARHGNPERSGKAQLRAVAVALVGGLVLTLLGVCLLDAARMRRRAGVRLAPADAFTQAPAAGEGRPGAAGEGRVAAVEGPGADGRPGVERERPGVDGRPETAGEGPAGAVGAGAGTGLEAGAPGLDAARNNGVAAGAGGSARRGSR